MNWLKQSVPVPRWELFALLALTALIARLW